MAQAVSEPAGDAERDPRRPGRRATRRGRGQRANALRRRTSPAGNARRARRVRGAGTRSDPRANEGTTVVAVPAEAADATVDVLRSVLETRQATVIENVQPRGLAPVIVRRALGQAVPLDEPLGSPLPRIC